MTMTEETAFPDWMDELLEPQSGLRLALQDAEGQLTTEDLSEITTDTLSESAFLRVNADDDPEYRYRATVNAEHGGIDCEKWLYTRFEWKGSVGEAGPLALIMEVPGGTPTARIGQELDLTTESLQDLFAHPGVQPATADRVAGLDEQKIELRQFLEVDNGDWGLSNRAGMLLEGPPGTGKTELVIELCEELFGGMPVTISGPEILSKWVGESERLLRKKFEEARQSTSQVLYIDEIDAIARSRSGTAQEHSAQLVAQLLVLLDGVEAKSRDDLKVIASTNLADVLDPALLRPGRLGNQPISFPRPGITIRQVIFHHYIELIRRSPSGELTSRLQDAVINPKDSDVLNKLAESADSFTGADIEDVIISAVTGKQTAETKHSTPLSFGDIQTHLNEHNIQTRGSSFKEESLPMADSTTVAVNLAGHGQVVRLQTPVADEELQAVLMSWRKRVDDSGKDAMLRTVSATKLLGSQVSQTRDQVVSAFQNDSTAPLYLHLSELPQISRAANHTPLARALIETMYECLLQWDERNLLTYESTESKEILDVAHLELSK